MAAAGGKSEERLNHLSRETGAETGAETEAEAEAEGGGAEATEYEVQMQSQRRDSN